LRRLLLKLNKKRAILLEKKMLKVKLSKVPLTAEDIVEYDRVKENWTLTRDIIGTPGAGNGSSLNTGTAMVVDNYKRKVHQRIGFPETESKT
jgi:hypothetical protein